MKFFALIAAVSAIHHTFESTRLRTKRTYEFPRRVERKRSARLRHHRTQQFSQISLTDRATVTIERLRQRFNVLYVARDTHLPQRLTLVRATRRNASSENAAHTIAFQIIIIILLRNRRRRRRRRTARCDALDFFKILLPLFLPAHAVDASRDDDVRAQSVGRQETFQMI